METSAKRGDNVDELFKLIAKDLLEIYGKEIESLKNKNNVYKVGSEDQKIHNQIVLVSK